jgi:hypothetical protein
MKSTPTIPILLPPQWLQAFWAALTLLLLFCACKSYPSPQTKEVYLQQFESLTEYACNNCNRLSKQKFIVLDATYEVLSQDLYEQYHDELSPEERADIQLFRLKYLKCKAQRKIISEGKKAYQKIEEYLLN